MTTLTAVRGDLTEQAVDAIVNAANEWMLGGGGVDGAIHRAAGPELVEACRAVPEVRPGVRCPTGEARLTEGFALPARFVIHTVGPRYVMKEHAALLASAFRASLTLAADHPEIRVVAFPAISCGVFGYPVAEAARIAVRVARERAWDLDEIRFVLFGAAELAAFEAALGSRR
ncbi:MAG: O-acetyl-ADP-ribose deacetylase [Sandaracinaceae bacterium]|nr:O-acetyl-ADP-ribose deacetylase [Sandaracinaceae bacterium]